MEFELEQGYKGKTKAVLKKDWNHTMSGIEKLQCGHQNNLNIHGNLDDEDKPIVRESGVCPPGCLNK